MLAAARPGGFLTNLASHFWTHIYWAPLTIKFLCFKSYHSKFQRFETPIFLLALTIKSKFSINISMTASFKNFESLKFEGIWIFLSTTR
jgi:hypothetical protein